MIGKNVKFNLVSVIVLFVLISHCYAKIHHLSLQDDARRNIELTNFGYNAGGSFEFLLSNFTVPDKVLTDLAEKRKTSSLGVIGFTFSQGDEIAEAVRSQPRVCQLQLTNDGKDALFFVFNFTHNRLDIIRSGALKSLKICSTLKECSERRQLRSVRSTVVDAITDEVSRELSAENETSIRETVKSATKIDRPTVLKTATAAPETNVKQNSDDEFYDVAPTFSSESLPLTRLDNQFATKFAIAFTSSQEGEYHFFYHNCFNYRQHGYSDRVAVDFTVAIVERNVDSYLAAGEIAKPRLYFVMSVIFFSTGLVWFYFLKSSRASDVYRVHKLMAALIFIKSLSLFFHGVNYYFVSLYGHQLEVWAFVFYLMHLLKGALLFGTIILIGTGYTFFKNFLTDKDRRLFMVVLPLQVLDNIALIIIDESEEGQQSYQFWLQIFIFVDLLCCAAILLPVIWSMRHLQEGAQSDGKAAFNLEKLKLFRHFYMIIICYIYLTRIIKFLVVFTVPFNYSWLVSIVEEIGTWFFFAVTGYKFRPAEHNPYLRLAQDDDSDLDEAVTQNGVLENVLRVNRTVIKEEDDLLMEEVASTVTPSHPYPPLKRDGSGPDIF